MPLADLLSSVPCLPSLAPALGSRLLGWGLLGLWPRRGPGTRVSLPATPPTDLTPTFPSLETPLPAPPGRPPSGWVCVSRRPWVCLHLPARLPVCPTAFLLHLSPSPPFRLSPTSHPHLRPAGSPALARSLSPSAHSPPPVLGTPASMEGWTGREGRPQPQVLALA